MAIRRLLLDPKLLVKKYVRGESALALSRQHGCSLQTVLRRLTESGIEIRQVGRKKTASLKLTRKKRLRLKEIVDGMLLGDGSIQVDGSLRLSQTALRVSWLRYVSSHLSRLGVKNRIIPIKPGRSFIGIRKINGKPSNLLYSAIYSDFKDERKRWYPHGTKEVPKDVAMTSMSVALWYCGDGTGSKTGLATFCTQGFSRKEVDRLGGLLGAAVGVKTSVYTSKDGPLISINRKDDAVKLKSFMKRHVPSVFSYKLENIRSSIPRGSVMRKLTTRKVRWLKTVHAAALLSVREIAQRLRISRVSVYNILSGKTYRSILS